MAQYDFYNPANRGAGVKGAIAATSSLFDGIEGRKINAMKIMGVEDAQRRQAMTDDAKTAELLIRNGDTQGAMDFLSGRAQDSSMSGGNPRETMEVYNALRAGDVDGALGMIGNYRSLFDDSYKAPETKKQSDKQKAEGGMVFNPNTGTYSIDPTAASRLDAIAAKKKSGEALSLKDKQSINKDITGFLKDTTLIHNTANDLSKLQKMPSGPASIALVFKFMKALDPTSVVREGEFSTAQNSAGVPEGIRNMYNKLASGEILGGKQIQQFVDTAQGLSNSAIESSRTQITDYLDTYGDSLPDKFSTSIMRRIPKTFEINQPSANVIKFDVNGNQIP